ncbi:MAG TPA: hypothetical protein VNR65_03875, partial [Geobacterales bacterium]|nr:hypothetical protein [Geobacterales bacterium]
FPPGTSKWNKIEHRLFSFISKNWRGQPLTSLKVIVNLIAGTTTKKGLKVHAEIDGQSYPAGIKVPDSKMADVSAGIKQQHFRRFCSSKEQTHWRGRGTHSKSVSKLLA